MTHRTASRTSVPFEVSIRFVTDPIQEEEFRMTNSDTVSEKNQKTVADYLADVSALETHIEEALDRQLEMFADQPELKKAVQGYHDMVKAQRDHVASLLEEEPKSSVTSTVKEAGASVLGKAAGLIDMIRTESQSKAFRDDYVAFNLAAISYAMLYTTATALGDTKIATMSEKHLTSYADAIQEINHLIPTVVVEELKKDDHTIVNSSVVEQSRKTIDRAWKITSN
jgi:ferritin-like metal-binding protein YciE